MWWYYQKTEMTYQTFKKYAEMSSVIESTSEEVCEEFKHSDFICRSVISIAVWNFYITSEFILLWDMSFIFSLYYSLINETRKWFTTYVELRTHE